MHSSLKEISELVLFLNPKSIHPLVIPLNSSLEDVHRLLRIHCRENKVPELPVVQGFGVLKNENVGSAGRLHLFTRYCVDI